MKKGIYYLFIFILFTCFLGINIAYSQSLSDFYKTAVKLYSNNYYSEARTLLLTILYTNNLTYSLSLYSKFLIAMTYAKESNFSKSILYLKNIQNIIKNNDVKYKNLLCEIDFQIAKLYFFEKKIDSFIEAKECFDSDCLLPNNKMTDELNLLEIAMLVYDMKWNDALNRVKFYTFDNNKLKIYLHSKLVKIINYKKKNPVLGGVLSIIPGLGHIYAGRICDGLRSFLFNSAFTGLTIYTAFYKEYLFTSIFGLTEVILYAANIYGGIDAVQQTNSLYYIRNRDEILKSIPISNIQIISIRKEIGL